MSARARQHRPLPEPAGAALATVTGDDVPSGAYAALWNSGHGAHRSGPDDNSSPEDNVVHDAVEKSGSTVDCSG